MGSIFKSSVTINSVLLVFEGILIINIPPLLEIPSKLSNSNATLTLPWNLRFWYVTRAIWIAMWGLE